MQYSKPMIDLVLELRRRAPSELKPGIKLANPDLFYELADYYHQTRDAVTRALIKELFQLAAGDWPARLEKPEEKVAQQVKVYRGQVSLSESRKPAQEPQPSDRPHRVYRGQVVYR
ncbi:hypothetical protein [Gilvimarinus xylanilyticus]|uniref:Uncharacterized protein n=1 Tax=Gilvimarinus xylanilyticus TaxID=2944139 RepID=A0A9X2I3R1_9GAMM|nr:hypothetical protein [Gilvimarinus xylanilyticus]MCP8899795.1 hypothetical protein [Gilvimarinus xylanilyticus]